MYSFELTYEDGGENLLFDPAVGHNTYGVRVVPKDGNSGDYADLGCNYVEQQIGSAASSEVSRFFKVDGPGSFKVAPANGNATAMHEPYLSGGVDGHIYDVWVFESPDDVIDGGGAGGGGGSPEVITALFTGPWSPDANPDPVDSDNSGISIDGVRALAMVVGTDFASTIDPNVGKLEAWVRGKGQTYWARASDLDLNVGEADYTNVGWPSAPVPISGGRICYLPAGMTISGGATDVYLTYQVVKS